VVSLLSPSTSGVVQLEGPQEVAGVLEVGAYSVDFVDQVLNTDDVLLAQVSFDSLVRFDGDTLSSHLDKSTFVDKFSNRLQVWSTPGNVGLFYDYELCVCAGRTVCSPLSRPGILDTKIS